MCCACATFPGAEADSPTLASLRAEMRSLQATVRSQQEEIDGLKERQERECARSAAVRRQAQAAEPAHPVAAVGRNVKVIVRKITSSNAFTQQWSGTATEPAGKGRRLQSGECHNLQSRMQPLNAACCQGPGKDCSKGYPTSCDAKCANVVVGSVYLIAIHAIPSINIIHAALVFSSP